MSLPAWFVLVFESNEALYHKSTQVRSQDLEKGGGGFIERVRKVQTTFTRILIVLESESHGLSEN